MIVLHSTTLEMLYKMYAPEQFEGVLEHINGFYESWLKTGEKGYPFMILQFGKFPLGDVPVGDPPKTYIWN